MSDQQVYQPIGDRPDVPADQRHIELRAGRQLFARGVQSAGELLGRLGAPLAQPPFQLGEGLLEYVGPLVEPGPREKPLSIAMREIHAGLLEHTEGE